MDIDMKNVEKKVVVQCLFSDEESWNLTLLTTKNMTDNSDSYIEDATVNISSGPGQSINLNYTGGGHYQSELKPIPGETYQLKINAPGYEEISAQSSIPVPAKAELDDFEINWQIYMTPNDFCDIDVFPINIRFDRPIPDANIIFRDWVFNPENGYIQYWLSSGALNKLKQQGIPTESVTRLEELINKWQIGSGIFSDCFIGTGTREEELSYTNMLDKELQKRTVAQREYGAFLSSMCVPKDEWLHNVSYDVYLVFGKGQDIKEAGLYYADPNLKSAMEGDFSHRPRPCKEYWLEVSQGSSDYYKYYHSYILQISQRLNPYSEPIVVYSNIENGVGIFAGLNRQMIHLLTF